MTVPELAGIVSARDVLRTAEHIASLQQSDGLIPWFAGAALVLAAIGLAIGFLVAPTDHQQGDAYRIIFVHVPAAWLSMLLLRTSVPTVSIGQVPSAAWCSSDQRNARRASSSKPATVSPIAPST